ncbi:liporeleasing system, ATP-binding protein [Lysobacter gummosus]|nr:liporeleasing system, ATP-binding protein [Lysobacter gummosus]
MLSCEGLAMTYSEGNLHTPVFDGLDLSVRRGETVAILGASGAGKSTLLHLLGGLDTPTAGEVYVGGHRMNGLPDRSRGILRNQSLGFIYQFHHLLPEFTALENVMLPVLLSGRSVRAKRARSWGGVVMAVPRYLFFDLPLAMVRSVSESVDAPSVAQARQRATALLESVGLGHRLQHKPGELSGGERQRAAVARALINRPACVLGDEPTGNLDEKTAATVFEIMLSLNREQGTSLVLVTHDRRLARRLDRVLELHEGKLRQLAPSEV